MTLKVKYENGKLFLLEKVTLENHKVYEVEIKNTEEVPTQKFEELLKLKGMISLGGDALEDTEKLYAK